MTLSSVHAGRPKLVRDLPSNHKSAHNAKRRNKLLANDTLRNAFLVAAATLLVYILTYPMSQ
jgi:hypothetical protein